MENSEHQDDLKSSTRSNFDYKISNKFEDLEIERIEDSDRYDSNGMKKSTVGDKKTIQKQVIRRTETKTISSPFQQQMGGFEDIVNKVVINDEEEQQIQGKENSLYF